MNAERKSQTRTGNWGNQVGPVAAVPPMPDYTPAAAGENFAAHLPLVPVVVEPPAKLLFTVRECATMTSLSEKTILRLLQRGKLRCLSSVRHKRIPAAELARFIRENIS